MDGTWDWRSTAEVGTHWRRDEDELGDDADEEEPGNVQSSHGLLRISVRNPDSRISLFVTGGEYVSSMHDDSQQHVTRYEIDDHDGAATITISSQTYATLFAAWARAQPSAGGPLEFGDFLVSAVRATIDRCREIRICDCAEHDGS